RHHDARGQSVLAALLVVLDRHQLYADELQVAEQALRGVGPDTEPAGVALIKEAVARALVSTHGDRKRALELAHEARELYAKLGPRVTRDMARIDDWLAKR